MAHGSALRPAVAAALAVLLAHAAAAADAPAAPAAPAAAALPAASVAPADRRLHPPSPVFRPERRAAPPAGARLVYFGGRVLGNVELVLVLWGEGRYAPYVTGEEHPSIPDLLGAVAGSPYVSGLAEYDTTRAAASGAPGTGQHVGPGRFGGVALVSPAPNGDVVDDATVTAELAARLGRGDLPAPRADAAGNLETLYLVYFPAGTRIRLGEDESCKAFCAYHGAFPFAGRSVPYAVLPDLSPGSGCDLGCGAGTPFANAAGVVTHEVVEAITDPDVGAAPALGPPLAWYDPMFGEAGDLCANEMGTVIGTDGAAWPVQKVWSNVRDACVVPGTTAAAPLVASAAPARPAPAAAAPPAGAEVPPAAALAVRPSAALAVHPVAAASAPAAPVPALAQLPRALPPEPTPLPLSRGVRVEILEENDSLSARRPTTDELYTNGLRVAARWPISPDGDAAREVGVAFGQNIYSPYDLRTRDLTILRQDRPYAGWLYLAGLFHSTEPAPHTLRLGADASGPGELDTDIEVAVGVTGPPSLGAEVQTRFHALLRRWSGSQTSSPNPSGWGVYQTATAPTLDATVRRQIDLVQASAALGDFTGETGSVLAFRLSPRARVDIGTTFDAIGAGLETRLGLLAARRGVRARTPFELYAFARADGRLVGRNALIEGPLRNGVTTLVGVRRQVADLELGAVLRYGHLEVGYATIWRTSELTPNPPLDRPVHAVGQVTVAYVGR